jgi:hypothetical protein
MHYRIYILIAFLLMAAAFCSHQIQANEKHNNAQEATASSIVRGFLESDKVENSAHQFNIIKNSMLMSAASWMDQNRLDLTGEKKYFGNPFIELLAESKNQDAIPYLYHDILFEVHSELKIQPDRPCFVLLLNYGPSVTDPLLACIAKSDYKNFDRQSAAIELLKAIYGTDDDDFAIIHQLIARHIRKNPRYVEYQRERLFAFENMLKASRSN